ncbi:MAG: indolepyruvate oxidoreductase subunit beta [Clostridia bacterium]
MNIMIVGVGGQGTLLASRILGSIFLSTGADVKVSEVHGMSQRGGSVVTYVKVADKVHAPTIEEQGADFILAFEQLEALRWIKYIKKDGIIIANNQKIDPMPVITGADVYPENVFDKIKSQGINIVELNALDIAEAAGSSKAVNVVLIGAFAKYTNIEYNIWIDTIKNLVPSKFIDLNIKAFDSGYNSK